ncbi:MAG: class IV adenylate cyclase [Spirochaetia bacterium]|nr:class IV adenylate cyclase [Spirochaetia bacterium]
MTEVEIKAHVYDLKALRERILQLEGICGPEYRHREDSYYGAGDGPGVLFRIRTEQDRCEITRKLKSMRGLAEVNREIEFSVSDPQACREFCESLGYQVVIRKEKRGEIFRHEEVSIELWEVTGLGSFIELEVLLEDPRGADEALVVIHALLERLQVPETAVEPRMYIDMLRSR